MENPTYINEKVLKKHFKILYKTTFPAGDKEISTEAAAKLVSESMAKVGKEYSEEQATELLKKFDVDENNMNTKKEVSSALLIAADLDVLDEAEILEMKEKWEKKKQKLLNSTPEMKAQRKKNKKLFKGSMILALQKHNPSDSDEISLETATTIINEVIAGMELTADEAQVADVLTQLDSTQTGVFTEKECKMAVTHLAGMKPIDFVSHTKKRNKRKMKADKKAMKMMQTPPA